MSQFSPLWGGAKGLQAMFVDDSCCIITHIYDNKMVPEGSAVGFQSVQVGWFND